MAYNLMQQGPLSVLLNAELLQFYHSGVWDPPGCDGSNLDHGELIVHWYLDQYMATIPYQRGVPWLCIGICG